MVGSTGKDQKAQNVGMLKWIHYISLKTLTNQGFTFFRKVRANSIIEKLIVKPHILSAHILSHTKLTAPRGTPRPEEGSFQLMSH